VNRCRIEQTLLERAMAVTLLSVLRMLKMPFSIVGDDLKIGIVDDDPDSDLLVFKEFKNACYNGNGCQ